MRNNYFENIIKMSDLNKELAGRKYYRPDEKDSTQNYLESEKETIEERENVLEEITEPTDEELKELEKEDEKAN
jgi:hypothetical protein